MAKGIEVAQAYVSIIPSMRGIQGDIADALDADRIGSDAGEQIGDGISGGISTKAVVIGNVIAEALSAAVSAAVDIGRDLASGIYDGFSANEQLIGGMEKLFGDSADTVVSNANAAFMTAGMSANDYMEQVTSFSASLVTSVGGDTAEAARLADVAMRAMSDNVNTFGTDASMVQNAIQGIAKGNYSMLDNLSLGFAGNQQGMMDLINASGVLGYELTDTAQLANVGFDTMIEAIQAVQEDMGIAGTTAREAMGTLEGSTNAASAAWQNMLTAIGTGDMSQVQAAASGLVDAVFGTIDAETGERTGGLIENLSGLVTRSFETLGQAIPQAFMAGMEMLPPDIGGPIMEMVEAIGTVVETVGPIVSDVIADLVTAIGSILPVVLPILPAIATAMGAIKIVGVITAIVGAVSGFIGTVSAALAAVSGIPAVIGAIVTIMGGPVTAIAAIVAAIVGFLATNENARTAIINAWNAIKAGIGNAINAAKTAVTNAVSAIVSGVQSRFQSLVSIVSGIFNSVKTAIMTPINAAKSAIQTAVNKIKSIINNMKLKLPKFELPHFKVSGGKAPYGIMGKGSLPKFSVSWYAKGGIVDGATLIGAGERGTELIWPGYSPYIDRYAQAIADAMPRGAAGGTNVYIGGNFNDDASVRNATRTYLTELSRLGAI